MGVRLMKKFSVILATVLFFVLPDSAHGQTLPYSWVPPYSCTAPLGQFFLSRQQNVYRLTGPIYVALPGLSYALSPLNFPSARSEGEVTLTLLKPANIINRYSLPPLTVVPPLWVDYSFSSDVLLRKLTIYINNPFDRINTKITCLIAGATQ
jgi:hypothetical protein